ncbi:MAG: 3-isopropylmalate dehydrogenase [Chloroflexi bacterium]|nr:3-isopropylmalate dehydrogenase [Chloroflexota bacterium]
MRFKVLVLPGDGIGPEVTGEAVKVMEAVSARTGLAVDYVRDEVGGAAMDRHGVPIREETLELARRSHAVLFGAVGGPRWDDPKAPVRPEQGLLALRKGMGVFANLRPVRVFPCLEAASPVKPERLRGVDLVVVRELTGGLYYATPKRRWQTSRGRAGVDTLKYTEAEIRRILRVGFELARARRKRLTSVDKANVLETSRLWREVASEMGCEYPDVALEHALVDSCAMQLVSNPARFDVLVMENTFGDILSDEASVLSASLGMLPSASLSRVPAGDGRGRGSRSPGLYEPVHGSAPDIAGQGKANPVGAILSAALMLRYSLGRPHEAALVERAVERALTGGLRTADIAAPGQRVVTTKEMGNAVAELVRTL